jgi:hypothetical protein
VAGHEGEALMTHSCPDLTCKSKRAVAVPKNSYFLVRKDLRTMRTVGFDRLFLLTLWRQYQLFGVDSRLRREQCLLCRWLTCNRVGHGLGSTIEIFGNTITEQLHSHAESQVGSELSGQAFCRRHGQAAKNLYRCRRVFGRAVAPGKTLSSEDWLCTGQAGVCGSPRGADDECFFLQFSIHYASVLNCDKGVALQHLT